MTVLDSLRPPAGLRVLVTAGASGVGAAVARAFQEAGAHVHVCDIDRTALERLASEAPAITGSLADAAITEDVDLVLDDVQGTLGGLDVLVNNAGIAGPIAAIDAIEPAQWERMIAVNLHSHFLFARRAVPLLKASRSNPCIVAMSSAAGRLGCAFRAPYAATQWAVIGMTKSLAAELGPDGVRVNAVLAGMVEGERMDAWILARAAATGTSPQLMREACLRKTSLRRMVSADEVAAMALFLASPAARNVTGQAMSVDANLECL